MQSLIQCKRATLLFLIPFALGCFAISPIAKAVSPAADGCYPNFTTAEGCNALSSLTTGEGNSGVGWRSLFSNATGDFNTGVGVGALVLNNADFNTAVGAAALLLNTSGTLNAAVGTGALVHNDNGNFNNAVGAFALFNNIDGSENNAFGENALRDNIHGSDNTAIGDGALGSNDVTGANLAVQNTAVGSGALTSNTDGDSNVAVGFLALNSNTTGVVNTANGAAALSANTTGGQNTAFGSSALLTNQSGNDNTAVGSGAGGSITGDFNICIGAAVVGFPGASNTIEIGDNLPNGAGQSACYIGGIAGQTVDPAGAASVYIDNSGKLGVFLSSQRFKRDIRPMEKASEAVLALKPVTFHYNKDAKNTPCFGLLAEQVAQVNPDLVVRNQKGELLTVRYDAVNAMLLNEFLKEHQTVQELKSNAAKQEAIIMQQQKQIEALTSGLQKVSAQLEASKPASQTVKNNE